MWHRITVDSQSGCLPELHEIIRAAEYRRFAADWVRPGDLASAGGQRSSAGIELGVRNEDLANAANVTQFTASRVLNPWQRSGLVTKTRGKIVLRSPEGLLLSTI